MDMSSIPVLAERHGLVVGAPPPSETPTSPGDSLG
jgi:hypothetical protein